MSRTDFNLRWREGKKVPCEIVRYSDAVVLNSTVYCRCASNCKVYAYHIPSSNWSFTPDSPCKGFALAVVDDLLTTVGGLSSGENTNKLLSLTGEGRGVGGGLRNSHQCHLAKCYYVSALCTGTTLIIVGGWGHGGRGGEDEALKTVEVLNTETREWHTTADLPQPLARSSITLCGGLVYLLGGGDKDGTATNSVYSCSLASLLSSAGSTSLGKRLVSTLTRSSRGSPWNRVADLPVELSTAVSLHGRLLAIGGEDSEYKPTTAVHMHQPTTKSWEVISL